MGVFWLKERRGPQIYLAQMPLFAQRYGKRWFYAREGQKIVGVLLLHKLEARDGWLVQRLITISEAPVGISEQLIVAALDQLQSEGCRILSFGTVQAQELKEIVGLDFFSAWLSRVAFKAAKKVFGLGRRRQFWRKFQPKPEPQYILFSQSRIRGRDVRCLLRTLNVNI